MKTRPRAWFCFAALVAVCAATWMAWRFNVSAEMSDIARHELNAQNNQLRDQLKNKPRIKPASNIEKAPTDTPNAQAAKEAAEKRRTETTAGVFAYYDRLNNDRDFQMKYYTAMRANYDRDYGPFFFAKHLTPEQVEAVCEALLQKELRYDKVPMAYLEQNFPVTDGTLGKQLRAEADKEYKKAIHAALGEDLAAQFATYERASPAWAEVGDFAARMAMAGMPVSLDQAARLVDVMCANSPAFSKGKEIDLKWVDWNAVDTQAGSILNAEQAEYFMKAMPIRYFNDLNDSVRKLRDAGNSKGTNTKK